LLGRSALGPPTLEFEAIFVPSLHPKRRVYKLPNLTVVCLSRHLHLGFSPARSDIHLPLLPLLLFVATYIGLAAGRIPGLKLDRTGYALLGAIGFLASGWISLGEAQAAVDVPTLSVLFGMMLLSAQYRLSGLYTAIGGRLARSGSPRRLLLGTIVAAALLAAVLTNDVVCFALAPLLAGALLRSGRKPLPYLLALACAANIGSALTPIGNPQNILIAQSLHLAFLPFLLACAVPVVLSLGFLYWLLARRLGDEPSAEIGKIGALGGLGGDAGMPLDRGAAIKAIVLTAVAIGLFLSPVPAPLTAIGIASVVLVSRRMPTRALLAEVDWQLLALFVGLFVVVRGFELSGWTEAARGVLAATHVDLSHPAVLVPVVAFLSNLVSNVPAVLLLLRFVDSLPKTGYLLALASTFAGNAILVGSIANLIVAEQAERLGIPFRFRDHLRVGLPVTLVSLAVTATVSALRFLG
jgi:Na+/H+ antiporter NhaD/arsenite permease-like protein